MQNSIEVLLHASFREVRLRAMATPVWQPVLDLWFGTLDELGRADEAHRDSWWAKDNAFDDTIRQRFQPLHDAIVARQCEAWLSDLHGCLAYVIVLDQFSRNMFRGTDRMFAADAQAREASELAVNRGDDLKLKFDERGFLYMPFMHSERLEDQERCIQLFQGLLDEQKDEKLRAAAKYSLEFAISHRDIVQKFGRFPHRNAVLERTSTAYELEFLLKPGSSF